MIKSDEQVNKNYQNRTKKWIHNGDAPFSLEKFRKAKNSRYLYHNKPLGGFWLTEYTPNGNFISNWHKWCYVSEYKLKRKNYIYTLDLKARIYTINNKKDFDYLLNRFSIIYSNPLDEVVLQCLDFESMQNYYDILFVSESGISKNKQLSAWDVSSLVVFNPSLVIEVDELI